MVVRACGSRQAGGAYLVTGTAKQGLPLENFLVDPPTPVDLEKLGISAIGIHLLEINGITHVIDVVGEEHYELPTDFAEEVRRFGLSRRIPRNAEFSRLVPGARILLVHRRAFIDNASEYYFVRRPDEWWCPKQNPEHLDPLYSGMCWSALYEDATGTPAQHPDAPGGVLTAGGVRSDLIGAGMHRRREEERAVVRTLPSFSYRALRRPAGVVPQYRYAIFMAMPINRVEIVRDRESSTHEETMHKASASQLPVELVEE